MDRPFRAYDGNERFVFVSYAHQDAELVYPEPVFKAEIADLRQR